ncbi:MAG TPA: PA2169 family four-helix-bundle protein [Saprospiraceae bacterium]|nr:PA2169 family four-helix-bundle protein [Saprospiraceae bacterium]
MKNDNSINVLNSLIVINNDRISGYQTAIDETDDQDLKIAFAQFVQTSSECKNELVKAVNSLGGTPEDGTRIDGKIYRAWMDFKAMVTGKDRKAILNSCEYGEDVAVNSYERAMKDPNLSSEHNSLISNQYAQIKEDHDTVKSMRDAEVDA